VRERRWVRVFFCDDPLLPDRLLLVDFGAAE
jgi:hypothetical protein